MEARTLQPGDQLSEQSGGIAVVVATRFEKHPEGIRVYNLRVAQCHTYFVREEHSDAEPVWVHNSYTDELRNTPGRATQSGPLEQVSGNWLSADAPAAIPGQIAATLSGQQFSRFADLRQAIWKAIAADDELSRVFSESNFGNIEGGNAPFAPSEFQINGSDAGMRFNLHHIEAIENGGAVYDLSNLQIVSPKIHLGLHS